MIFVLTVISIAASIFRVLACTSFRANINALQRQPNEDDDTLLVCVCMSVCAVRLSANEWQLSELIVCVVLASRLQFIFGYMPVAFFCIVMPYLILLPLLIFCTIICMYSNIMSLCSPTSYYSFPEQEK